MRKNSHRAYVVRLSVAPVVDRYDEDWARLGWVMLRGRAEILSAGTKHEEAQMLLRSRYPQLGGMQIAKYPVIASVGVMIVGLDRRHRHVLKLTGDSPPVLLKVKAEPRLKAMEMCIAQTRDQGCARCRRSPRRYGQETGD